ncbi:MAG: hypothetical protein WDN23_02275 [Edaphobacter sp.]
MMRPDDAMEKVLAGLRDVEAPAGMERRVLELLEGAAEVQGKGSWRPLWTMTAARPGLRMALVSGAAVLAAVALAIPMMHWLGGTARVSGRAPVANLNAKGIDGAVRGNGGVAVDGPRRVAERVSGAGGARIVSAGAGAEEAGGVSDMDSVAMSEMKAASFPAPPMPLTEQERLLLRMVHRGDQVELAMLDPKAEALQDAEDKAEFQRFFAKAPVKDPAAEVAPAQDAPEQAAPSGDQVSPGEAPAEEPKREESTMKQGVPQVKTVESQ